MGIHFLTVVIAAACLPVSSLSAEATVKLPFEVRVVVPVPAGDIGEVRLGGKTCRLVATAPASESHALVFINNWGRARNEEALYRELAGADLPPSGLGQG